MSTDLSMYDYTGLLNLQKEVNAAVDERRDEEDETARKAWLASDAAKAFGERVADLRKKFEKLSGRCTKAKSKTLRIKLNVDMQPQDFNEMLEGSYERSFCEMFNVECSGEVLNIDNCGNLYDEIQCRVDDVMGDVCEEAAGIHGQLKDDCEDFTEEYNKVVSELREAQTFGVTLRDVEKACTAPKKKAAKKTKKGKK